MHHSQETASRAPRAAGCPARRQGRGFWSSARHGCGRGRVVLAKARRQRAPGTAVARHPERGIEKEPVIDACPAHAARFARQIGSQSSPGTVINFSQIAHECKGNCPYNLGRRPRAFYFWPPAPSDGPAYFIHFPVAEGGSPVYFIVSPARAAGARGIVFPAPPLPAGAPEITSVPGPRPAGSSVISSSFGAGLLSGSAF